jgi:hypothetical protein
MTYSHNANDPMVILASTAQTLLDQYNSNTISLQQYKTFVNAQIVSSLPGLNKSSNNDDAWHTITTAVAMVDAVE